MFSRRVQSMVTLLRKVSTSDVPFVQPSLWRFDWGILLGPPSASYRASPPCPSRSESIMKTKERSMVSSLKFPLLLLSIGLGVTPQIYPQKKGICEVKFSVLNTDRYVYGPVETECPGGIHSAPFGNWGVKTETSDKKDGHQFDGWCHDHRVINESVPPGVRGRYKTYCGDDWYEWNSCTTNQLYATPNSDFYNYNNDTQ